MSLRDEILATCSPELIASRDCRAIATAVSAGRTRPTGEEIGNGRVLEVLGLEDGNALLDAIHAHPAFRYVLPLLEQGRLQIGSPIVGQALQGLVAAQVLSQANADKLTALGVVPHPVSIEQVFAALEGL